MRTKQLTGVRFDGPGSLSKYTVDLPAGLACKMITEGSIKGNYWLDEFPENIFPPDSLIRHDAVHYGLILTPSQVEP